MTAKTSSAPPFDLDRHTMFLGLTGSHAYGMARPDSDVDIRGVCIPPRRVRESHYLKFEQHTAPHQRGAWGPRSQEAIDKLLGHPTAGECYRRSDPMRRTNGEADLCVYSVHKFVGLCAVNNPSFLEILFLPEQAVLYATESWRRLAEQRRMFLTSECRHRYVGYAMHQLARIRRHRQWLLNPPKAAPSRRDFGLPEKSALPADMRNQIDEAVRKVVRGWQVEDGLEDYLSGPVQDTLRERMRDFQATLLRCEDAALDEKTYLLAAASIGLTRDVLSTIKRERRYRAARSNWTQFLDWKKDRNPARAELEARFGYDAKHASHLIRLLRTGLEILRDGELRVYREDAEEIMAIRDGRMSYEELMEASERIQTEIGVAAETCDLPDEVPREAIDELLRSVLD